MKGKILRWLGLGACVCVIAILLWPGLQKWRADRAPVQRVEASAQEIARGRYLVNAGDCVSCHTVPGGAPLAGGVPLHTPFGTLYGTNITPDATHGIGRYTAEEFHDVVTTGRSRDGRPLYPAMPYTSYAALTRQDTRAIRAWLMQQAPMTQANRKPELSFPANLRIGLLFWQALFSGRTQPPSSKGSTVAWQRGKYLVDVLGHCGECHTPRGALGEQELGNPMSGNPALGNFAAPDLRPAALAARGWDAKELQRYLGTGAVDHAVASDEMLTVVRMSTSRLSGSDLANMSTYLLGDVAPVPTRITHAAEIRIGQAKRDYLALCSGCHGAGGEGVPNVAVKLVGNTALRDTNPHNLLLAILHGLPEHALPGLAHMQAMPGFADDLSDARIAELATWLRSSYGAQPLRVEPEQARKLRRPVTYD